MATNANPNAIITQEQVAIEDVKRLMNIVIGLKNDVFIEGVDYGVIPGTGDKPTLLQPGMEKLLRALHLRAEYVERSKIEDFDKGLFFYRYECRLIDWETNICLGTAIGSANSYESKWRWRDSKRTCPKCGKQAIRRSKFPPKNNPNADPGWYCYDKDGGCGANFAANDATITGQTVGRVENPDIFDQMNTCDKIGQKRSLGSAVKTVANVSMIYNIDLEDFAPYSVSAGRGDIIEGDFIVVEHAKSLEQPSARVSGAGIPREYRDPLMTDMKRDFDRAGKEQANMRQRPDETETDPTLYDYLCDALTVQVASADADKLWIFHAAKEKVNIVVTDSALFDNLSLIDPRKMTKGRQTLVSPVVVTAWADAQGWHVERISDSVPQPEVTA